MDNVQLDDMGVKLHILRNPLPKDGTAVRIYREPHTGAFVLTCVIFFDKSYSNILGYVEEYLNRYCEAGDYTVEFVDIKTRKEKRQEMRYSVGIKDVEL